METRGEERRVLVIDDDDAVLSSLKFSLEIEGYSVAVSTNGVDLPGVEIFSGPGCLVVDFDLPRLNGLELLADFRLRGVAWPAILITTNPPVSVRERARAAGVAIVEKPLFGNALLDAIRAAFAGEGHSRST